VHGGKGNASFQLGFPWWGFGEGDEDDERVKDGIYNL